MSRSDDMRRRPLLEPTDRIAEIIFGLIMTTTFTGTLSATAGREDVRTMLIGAIGCNLAWGLVDAVMCVVTTLTERGRNLRSLQQVEIDRLWARVQSLPEPPRRPRLDAHDFAAAAAVFLQVVAMDVPLSLGPILGRRTAHRVPALVLRKDFLRDPLIKPASPSLRAKRSNPDV